MFVTEMLLATDFQHAYAKTRSYTKKGPVAARRQADTYSTYVVLLCIGLCLLLDES